MSLTVSIFQRPIRKNMYKLEISKKSQQSEAAKLITKMIMLHHIFLIDIKKHFLQMIYISRYKKKWSFSQTKVKVDNNPKSRFFLLGLKYTYLRIKFFCRIPVMNWEIFLQEFDKNCFNSKYVLKNNFRTLYKHYL